MQAFRIVATILAGPFLLIGAVWIGQGFNLIPGSFMTGDLKWAVIGAVLVVVGATLVWWVNRRR
jgi:hypothetical protein